MKVADGRGGNWEKTLPGVADDHEQADGEHILTFWEACEKARSLARGGRSGRPETLAEAIYSYEADLRARSGDVANAKRARHYLPPVLLSKPVGLLTSRDLSRWRDDMLKDTKGPTLLRIIRALRAALNLAARHDKRITNRDVWREGLQIGREVETFKARNVILKDHEVARIVAEAYALDPAFGLYVETHAVTGARSSQIARLDIGDLQDDRPDPRLMMPPSRKGAKRDHTPKPVPITADLARKLRMAGGRRARTAPLLVRVDGERWRPEVDDHLKPFAAAAKRAGIKATIYALRHSSIVRLLLAGVPIRVVAVAHDTSVIQIERTYSAHITDHADEVMRAGLLDLTPSASDSNNNVVALPPKRRS